MGLEFNNSSNLINEMEMETNEIEKGHNSQNN